MKKKLTKNLFLINILFYNDIINYLKIKYKNSFIQNILKHRAFIH